MSIAQILVAAVLSVIVIRSVVVFIDDVQADVEFTQNCQVRGGVVVETLKARYCLDQHVVSLEEPK